jgi:hypothetical protein
MPYADVTKRRTYHAGYMQQWRARKAQQTPAPLPAASPPEASALVHAAQQLATAQRLHTTADHLRRQTVELRSLYDPKLLEYVDQLACLHVEVTSLLVQIVSRSTR